MCCGKEDNGANAMSKRRGAEGSRFGGKPVAEIGRKCKWGLHQGSRKDAKAQRKEEGGFAQISRSEPLRLCAFA